MPTELWGGQLPRATFESPPPTLRADPEPSSRLRRGWRAGQGSIAARADDAAGVEADGPLDPRIEAFGGPAGPALEAELEKGLWDRGRGA